jgi:TorA maturation chaperone TorD
MDMISDLEEATGRPGGAGLDETDLARSQEYALLGALLLRAPDAELLSRLATLEGSDTPLGAAHAGLASAAAAAEAPQVKREYFELFEGVGRGELLPYASYYLTGFLNERPLAHLRSDLGRLGLERAEGHFEPEDHLGTLCEVMSGLAAGRFEAAPGEEESFFSRHLLPWAERFFADLEQAGPARFYKAVGTVGRIFVAIEAAGFDMADHRHS